MLSVCPASRNLVPGYFLMNSAASLSLARYSGRTAALLKSNSICRVNFKSQPCSSTITPFGVFGHLSRLFGTPSPSSSPSTGAGGGTTGAGLTTGAGAGLGGAGGQPTASTATPAGVPGHLSRL